LIILITNNFKEFYTKTFGTPSKFIDTIAQKKPPLYFYIAGGSYSFKTCLNELKTIETKL